MAKKPTKKPSASPRKGKTKLPGKSKAVDPFDIFEHLTLVSVRLIDLNAKIEISDGKTPDKPSLESAVTIGPSHGEGVVLVDGFARIESRPKDAIESTSILIIAVHLQCVYRVVGIDVSNVEKHSQTIAQTALLIMWPHFRELIQSISGRMGIKPIVLPMYLTGSQGTGKGENATLVTE